MSVQTRSRAAYTRQRAARLVGVEDPEERFKVTMRHVRLYDLIGAMCRTRLYVMPVLGRVLSAESDAVATARWLEAVERCDDELCGALDRLSECDHRIPELGDAAVTEYLAKKAKIN